MNINEQIINNNNNFMDQIGSTAVTATKEENLTLQQQFNIMNDMMSATLQGLIGDGPTTQKLGSNQTNNNNNNNNNNATFDDLPPMTIYRSMSDASAIRRNQQLLNNTSNYPRHDLFGSSWTDNGPTGALPPHLNHHHLNHINNQTSLHMQHKHNSDLFSIISPGGPGSIARAMMLPNDNNNSSSSINATPGGGGGGQSPSSLMFSMNNNNSNQQSSSSCDPLFIKNNNNSSSNNQLNGGGYSPLPPQPSSTTIPNGNLSMMATTTNHTDEDDYDLNLVFDEIGALQNKGLNEPEDDNSTAPLQFPTPRSMSMSAVIGRDHHHQQQQQISPPKSSSTTITAKAASSDSSTAPTPSTNNNNSTTTTTTTVKQAAIEVDGKMYKYNPEIYDPTDITLANEKYSLNAHYLRDFRCEQCPLFLQHKCTQHKPFTCFHWHFANQRRRRPLKKRDGTFNYSPDIYCTKYDDTTGICPDGDDCPYLHRTAGDTERRYHLRYYKTGMCVYETDSRGYCVKNGAHCAFAHGSHDLRMAIFDVREQQAPNSGGPGSANNNSSSGGGGAGQSGQTDGNDQTDGLCNGGQNGLTNGGNNGGHFDKDRNAVNEDPRWQDTAFVLAYYKTEFCKRPPRLCRQGYACPQYHNNKDRRRSPKKFKYRSTPCPNVKQGDEWGDPANCENQDDCNYCHTRTEQQFHPEIYKSTKCNDIQQNGYCPRASFCAFAHSESSEEINAAREFSMDPNTDIPLSISQNSTKNSSTTQQQQQHSNTSPVEIIRANSYSRSSSSNNNNNGNNHHGNNNHNNNTNTNNTTAMMIASSLPEHGEFATGFVDLCSAPAHQVNQLELNGNGNHNQNGQNNLGPIARPRSFSTSTTTKTVPMSSWLSDKNNLMLKQQVAAKQQNPNLFSASSSTSLFPSLHSEAQPSTATQNPAQNPQCVPSLFHDSVAAAAAAAQQNNAHIDSILNHHDLAFNNELESLVNKTENHLTLDGANAQANINPFNTMLRRGSLFNESEPINIPHRMGNATDIHRSTSAAGFANISPPNHLNAAAASPIGSFLAQNRQQSLPNGGGSMFDQFTSGGGVNGTGLGPSPQPTPPAPANSLATPNQNYISVAFMEMQRLKEENNVAKNRIAEFQEKMQQVIQLYQLQLNEAHKKEKLAEKTRDEALNRLNSTQKELEMLRTNESNAKRVNDLSTMSRSQLIQLKQKLAQDLSCVDEALKIGANGTQSGTV